MRLLPLTPAFTSKVALLTTIEASDLGDGTEETTLRAGNIVVLDERTGVFPVTETDTVVVWSATEIKDDTEDDQTSNRNDLD